VKTYKTAQKYDSISNNQNYGKNIELKNETKLEVK